MVFGKTTIGSTPAGAKARGALVMASAVLALATPGLAHATDGYFLNGQGAKAKGAGGVSIALPQDAMATASNPAVATDLDHRLDVGFEVFVPSRGASVSGNFAGLNGRYSGNGANPFILPEVGYVRPLSDKVSVALTINGNGGMNTHYKRNPFASFGATGAAGVNLRQIFIAPSLAVEVAEGQSLGVSPILLVQSFEAHGIQPFAAASADPAHFTNKGSDWGFGAGVRVGWYGKFGDAVSAGAFYQSKIQASRFDKYAGLFAERGGFDVPASWGAGIAVRPSERVSLGFDFKRILYSGVKSVGTPLAPLFSGVPFGAKGGPGFGWRDVSVFKVGGNFQVSDSLTLRAGYGRTENPVPRSETMLNILAPGVVRGHITGGATIKFGDKFEVTGYAMHAPRQTVRGSGSIPAPYGGGEADVHLAETSAGMSFGIQF